ncbi:MAG: hypothetical protein ACXVFQ_00605 [Solirubrobacteraceae bacterium]
MSSTNELRILGALVALRDAPMPELTEPVVRYLTEIDHRKHEAMIALDEETGEGVGVARCVRDRDRPHAAGVAVTVIDDWQRRRDGAGCSNARSWRKPGSESR